MAKDAVFKMKIEEELIKNVEALYESLGTSFEEAVTLFAKQSLQEKGFPNHFKLNESESIYTKDTDITEFRADIKKIMK